MRPWHIRGRATSFIFGNVAHEGGELAHQGQVGARFLRCMENMLGSLVIIPKTAENTSKIFKHGGGISRLFSLEAALSFMKKAI